MPAAVPRPVRHRRTLQPVRPTPVPPQGAARRARGTHDPPPRPGPRRAVRGRPGPGEQPAGEVLRQRGPARRAHPHHHRRPRQAPLPGLRLHRLGPHPPRPLRQTRFRYGPGATAHRHGPPPAGQRGPLRRSARPHHLRPDHRAREARDTRAPGPRPAPRRRGRGARLAADLPQPDHRRRPPDGPEGHRGRRQRLPGRGPLPPRHRPVPHRQGPHPRRVGPHLGGPGGADARGRTEQPDRHRPPRAPARGDGPPAPQGRPRRRGLRLPPGQPALPHLLHRDPDGGPRRPQPLLVPRCQTPGGRADA